MKTLFFVLQTFFLVFFLGCQENSVTDPGTLDENSLVQSTQSDGNFSSKDLISSYPRWIIVENQVYDPTHPANTVEPIKGIIRYDHKIVPLYSSPDINQYRIQIKLYIDLIIDANCPDNHGCMKVSGLSTQTVDFLGSAEGVISFSKVFSVRNTCCGAMNLVVKFYVDKDDLHLVSLNLKEIFSTRTDKDDF